MNIIGLMAIPPNDNNPKNILKELNNLNISLGLKELKYGYVCRLFISN